MSATGSALVGPYELSWGSATHPGHHRELNEDAFVAAPGVYVVADGMGGHEAGELASGLVVETFLDVVDDGPPEIEALEQLVARANSGIIGRSIADGTPGMGTTAVGCVVVRNGNEHSLVVFNIGDSRCYRLVDGVLSQITVDHSHVQELVAAGELGSEDARTHPLRNVVTRALGTDDVAIADYRVLDDRASMCLILCSDGLSGELTDDEMLALVADAADPQVAADALVDSVLEGEATDNVTAVVVAVVAVGAVGGEAHDLDDTQPRGIPVTAVELLPPPDVGDLIDDVPGAPGPTGSPASPDGEVEDR